MIAVDGVRDALRLRFGDPPPEVGLVLGSGFGGVTAGLSASSSVAYAEVGLPPTSISGHAGQVVVGLAGGRRVACLAGRNHLYEGHDPATAVLGVRALVRWGVRALVLTASVGSLHPEIGPGEIVLLTDHINFLGANPLRGPNLDALGPRFPDLSEVYSTTLGNASLALAAKLGLRLHRGVYGAMPGPSFETPAEIRMLRIVGADVVGMSVVPEAIVAGHAGLPVVGFTIIANLAAGMAATPLDHETCTAAVAEGAKGLTRLILALLEAWPMR
jgi:xanthosine phosphorylase